MVCPPERRVALVLALIVVIGLAACQLPSPNSRQRAGAESTPAQKAEAPLPRMPSFTLKDVSGRDVSSEQWRGKVLLVDFWATWCPPCRKEMPEFEELYKRYQERGFMVIGISLDFDEKDVIKFAKELGITYPLLMSTSPVQEQWGGLRGIPTTFLVDRTGVIRKTIVGFEYKDAFEAELKKLL